MRYPPGGGAYAFRSLAVALRLRASSVGGTTTMILTSHTLYYLISIKYRSKKKKTRTVFGVVDRLKLYEINYVVNPGNLYSRPVAFKLHVNYSNTSTQYLCAATCTLQLLGRSRLFRAWSKWNRKKDQFFTRYWGYVKKKKNHTHLLGYI